MADKNFKIKTGLDLPAPLPAEQGGTGQTSLSNAANALLPVQTSLTGYFLQTNGTNPLWAIPAYSIIAEDGVAKPARQTINFSGIMVTDDSANNRTNVTIGKSISFLLMGA
jgi:hypothetical protein